jgi:hypothetical protein
MKRKSKSRKTNKRAEACIVLDKSLKRALKVQASKEERAGGVSALISEASRKYLDEKREQAKEARERKREERAQKSNA